MTDFLQITISSTATVATLMLCAAVGYFLRKYDVVPRQFSVIISKLVFYVFLPCMLFTKTAAYITPERISGIWIFPASFLLFMFLGLGLSYLTVKIFKTNRDFVRPVIASTTFHNSGYLPISLMVTACEVFPVLRNDPAAERESITFISAYLLTSTTLLWTLGFAIISGRNHRTFDWKKVITPPIIGLVAGTAIGLVPPVSKVLVHGSGLLFPLFGAADLLARGVIPCVLLLVGAGLANLPKVGGICKKTVISAIAIRLIIIPAFALVYIYFLRKWGIMEMTLLPSLVLAVEACMPPANNLIVMASLTDQKAESGLAILMFWSYLVSIVTITLVVSTAVYLFE